MNAARIFAPLAVTQYGTGFLDFERHLLWLPLRNATLSAPVLFWRPADASEAAQFWAEKARLRQLAEVAP